MMRGVPRRPTKSVMLLAWFGWLRPKLIDLWAVGGSHIQSPHWFRTFPMVPHRHFGRPSQRAGRSSHPCPPERPVRAGETGGGGTLKEVPPVASILVPRPRRRVSSLRRVVEAAGVLRLRPAFPPGSGYSGDQGFPGAGLNHTHMLSRRFPRYVAWHPVGPGS